LYKGKKIGVSTAAYNEERFIKEVIETMPSFVDIIYVTNDCSTDRTAEILKRIKDDRVVIITNPKRMGAGATTLSGHKKALEDGMDVIAVMAGDGQMDPAILDRILGPVVEGKADYSKGDRLSVPQHKNGMPAWRAFGNFLLTYLTRIASGYWHISDPQNGYTAISRCVLERIDLNKVETGFAFENDLLVKLHVCGARVVSVPHPARYRGERSKIKYLHFMVTTSWLLLKDFLWRLWVEYVRRPSDKTQG
jgi:glycosyltransferase involved in cell wall biosynthesis